MSAPGTPVPERRGYLRRFVSLAGVPLGAVALAFALGSVLILLTSLSTSGHVDLLLPLKAYGSMLHGAGLPIDSIIANPAGALQDPLNQLINVNGLIDTIVQTGPLVLGGLAVGIGFKAGLFNIGAQGQFLMGATIAAGIGAAVAHWPAPLAIAAALLGGAAAGAFAGFIPGALKAWTGAHEVVTTIMLNTIIAAFISYLVSGPLLAPGFSFDRTGDIGNAALPAFSRSLTIGVFFAIAAVPIIWWLLWRSTLGFEIRTVGANPSAGRYAGMRPVFIIVFTMSLSGLLAGLAGGLEVLGTTGFAYAGYSTSIGFDAITVALLGRAHPVGILFASLLFGAMRAGANLMQIQAQVPKEMVDILQATVLLFVAADVIIRQVFRIRAAGAGIQELQTVTRSYGEGVAR